MRVQSAVLFVLCALSVSLFAGGWPDQTYVTRTNKRLDDYYGALKRVQDFRGCSQQHPRDFVKALDALERSLAEVKVVRQELKTWHAVARSKGALTWHRLKRWFVTSTLPSDTIFIHHVQSAESPASYRESAITFFESAQGVSKKIAQEGIKAIREKKHLTYQQRVLLRNLYARWRETIDDELKQNSKIKDLQLLVSIRNHENPEVLDLFRMPQPRACILQVFVTKKDVLVPSQATKKLLAQIPHRNLYDKIKDGQRLLTFYRSKMC